MNDMYDGKEGKIASIIVYIKEILPFSDYLPTFTLVWFYTFFLSSRKNTEIIMVKMNIPEKSPELYIQI
jgi:hypothetical protein